MVADCNFIQERAWYSLRWQQQIRGNGNVILVSRSSRRNYWREFCW